MGNNKFIHQDFRGYKQSEVPKIDEALARTDPKTPCGEYLRRYWHPVALTSVALGRFTHAGMQSQISAGTTTAVS